MRFGSRRGGIVYYFFLSIVIESFEFDFTTIPRGLNQQLATIDFQMDNSLRLLRIRKL